jgi:hypothetical protein
MKRIYQTVVPPDICNSAGTVPLRTKTFWHRGAVDDAGLLKPELNLEYLILNGMSFVLGSIYCCLPCPGQGRTLPVGAVHSAQHLHEQNFEKHALYKLFWHRPPPHAIPLSAHPLNLTNTGSSAR